MNNLPMKLFASSFILILITSTSALFSQNIVYTNLPAHLQLFPRDHQDSAEVVISGAVLASGYDEIIVDVDTNNVLWKRMTQSLDYSGGNPTFSLNPKIFADTVEFSFEVSLRQGVATITDTLIDRVVCGDVYFINGQSNATNDGGDSSNPWVRSFGTSKNSKDATNDKNWYLANKGRYGAGAVGCWGLRLGILIATNHGVPVCILQQGQGGRIISYFTNGIGGDTLPESSNFDRLLVRASNAGVTDAVKAIFWWQGESDSDSSLVENYYRSFFIDSLYNGWRTYYPNIQRVYTTQIHPGGAYGDRLREIQRKIAEDSAKIEIITPHNIGGFDGLHFSVEGYQNFAAKLYRLVARDFYGGADTVDISPPNIVQAYFTDSNKNVLILKFDNTNPLTLDTDTTIGLNTYFLKDHFYFHNSDGTIDTLVSNITVFGNKLRLGLESSSSADSITYLPAQYYNGSATVYDGPWIKNSKSVSALTFHKFPIDSQPGDDPLPVTLSIFSANYIHGKVILKWRTESEINNLGFNVLRKQQSDANYRVIASYENNAVLTGKGTTTQPSDYEFSDADIVEDQTYYYMLQDVDYNGVKTNYGPLVITAVESAVPLAYRLYQNYPNPFNPETTISFFIPQPQFVTLRVFDTLGRTVGTLINQQIDAGYHAILYKPTNLASGAYYYQIQTEDFSETKRMSFVK